MKISDKTPVQDLIQPRPITTSPKNKADFAQTLAQAGAGNSPKTAASGGPSAAQGLNGVSPVNQIISSNMAEPAARMEQTLGLLDRYAQALADPGQSLKQVSSLVRDLEQEADKLAHLSQSLPQDHGLKSSLDQTAVLAAVEAAKFNRGDYI